MMIDPIRPSLVRSKLSSSLRPLSLFCALPYRIQTQYPPPLSTMTTYGTIPTSSNPSAPTTSSAFDYIHRAKARGASALATRRPWRELVDASSFGLPPTLGEGYLRLRSNLIYFAMNYAIIILLIVFLSLLWHPISLIVFIVTMIAWLFFFFLKEEPLVIYGREISDSVVLSVLAVVTLVLLLLTNATENILVSLLLGVVVVAAHASLRKAEELVMEEDAAGPGRWYQSVSEEVSKTAGTSRY